MIYEAIGRAVVKAAKIYLRRKYGPTYVPKPVLAGAIVAVLAVIAIGFARDENAV